jgi:hypothetical protein
VAAGKAIGFGANTAREAVIINEKFIFFIFLGTTAIGGGCGMHGCGMQGPKINRVKS